MHTNRLAQEKSPYLLQHQHNPVDWFPWGDEAFKRAEREDKPIFLSIGYSTCYWCHVMEKDSFEIDEVATVLNKGFISIKVDREERPDVDSIYMSAVMGMTGHGGWPMSVFLTPSRKPFFAGTYFKREQFIPLLNQISRTWTEKRQAIEESAERVTEALLEERSAGSAGPVDAPGLFRKILGQLEESFDETYGGFSTAPKFPPSATISLLLRIARRSSNAQAKGMALMTLERMARGGIYDHLGGGFARYSTDARWLVPHFEKMLYDNAQLAVAYLEGYQASGEEQFAAVAREVLNYTLQQMTAPEGGFYSAEDAGEVDKEGEFYVWQETELRELLTAEEFGEMQRIYGVSAAGNFEHQSNVLALADEVEWEDKSTPLAKAAHEKLLHARNARTRPHKDDKILTSWNGLMIHAMAKGYQVLGDERYLEAAQAAAAFLQQRLYQNGTLLRRYRDNDARYPGYVDDYAFTIQGLITLYESCFDLKWLSWAIELQTTLDQQFWDEQRHGYFFTTAGDASLIKRDREFTDGAEPAGNSVAALNLLRLYGLTIELSYRQRAEQIFVAAAPLLQRFPAAFACLLCALDFASDEAKEIVIIGEPESAESKEFLGEIWRRFLPNRTIAAGAAGSFKSFPALVDKTELNGRTTFYVCEEGRCQQPTNDAAAALALCI